MRVWVTRTQPGADASAARLVHLGHDPIVAPVLEQRPLANPALDLTDAVALAFTSANAIDAFTRLSDRRDLEVFVTGTATAAAAHRAGFESTWSADGNVADLAELILKEGVTGKVVWAGPTEPAGDLPALLAAGGGHGVLQPVYQTIETGVALPARIDAILIHSPKAARAVAKAVSEKAARKLSVFAISSAAAAPLAKLPFKRVATAPRPDETALLTLLAG